MSNHLLKAIKESLAAAEQATLFDSNGEDKIKTACINYLKFNGYKVVSPKTFSTKIEDTMSLIMYFYELFNRKNPKNFVTSYNKQKDMAIAKRFINSRMEVTGASKEHALNECGEIIKTVFDNEEIFKFDRDISFYIFGQANMKWVTDRALQIMNNGLKEREEIEAEKMREEMLKNQDTSDLGFDDLDDILARLEEEDG